MSFIKIKICNHILEIKEYESLSLYIEEEEKDNSTEYGESINNEENYLRTIRHRRETVRDLAIMNFDVKTSKFLTLTFRDTTDFDIKSTKDCAKEFAKFIKRLKYYYPKVKYLAVVEFQDKNDRGAVHYHMLIQLPYVPVEKLSKIWSHGYIFITKIDHVDNIGAYVTKYMTKDNADLRLKMVKGYYCSQNLKRPLTLKSWALKSASDKAAYYKIMTDIRTHKVGPVVYAHKYITDNGEILYKQYNNLR